MGKTLEQKNIPAYLIYETLDGKDIYYKGWQDVLNQSKTLEEIMGCSDLQGLIVSRILRYLYKFLDEDKYEILTNEVGLHLGKKTNISSDIAIFDKKLLQKTPFKNKYFEIAPMVVIEVDTNAETGDFSNPLNYYHLKTQKLLDFGVKEVVWIFSETKKVTYAQKGENWLTMDWDKEIKILGNYTFSLGDLVKDEGI